MPSNTHKILGDSWKNSVDKDIHLTVYGTEKTGLLGYLALPKTILYLIGNILKLNPDIIHVQESGSIAITAILPFISKYPIVTTNHDVKPHLGLDKGIWGIYREIMRKIATRYSKMIFVHGTYLKDLAIDYLHLLPEKVQVIPIGEQDVLPFKKFINEDMNAPSNEKTILFFGRIHEYKGLKYLIEAEPIISREIPNIKIVIAGIGEDFRKYEDMMINKQNFIVHNYHIPYDEGAQLIQKAKLIVLPYVDASQSGVIPIAYGFKKPVVVTNVGSIPEIVDNGITGYIVPPRDPVALGNAIIKMLKNEELLQEMGENAYDKLKRDLSWERISKITVEAYHRACNELSPITRHENW